MGSQEGACSLAVVRRAIETSGRRRKDFMPVLGHANRMLELGRERTILGDSGPAIGQDFGLVAAGIDHRFDCEEHAFADFRAFAGGAVMQDTRRRMKHLAKAVTAKIPDHREALLFDKTLNGMADIANRGAGPDDFNAAHQRLVSHFDEPFPFYADIADREHPAGIAMPAIERHRDVDIDDVSIAQNFVARDAVTDYVVD